MTDGAAGRLRESYVRVTTTWFAADAVGLRLLPVTVSFAVVLVILQVSGVGGSAAALAVAAGLVAAVQLVGSLGRWDRWPHAWQYVLPLVQMLAIGLLEVGARLTLASFDVLLFLPVVSLALQPGLWGIVVALGGSVVVLFGPALFPLGEAERVHPAMHALVDLIVIAFVAVGSHGIVAVARRQAADLERARDELEDGATRLRDSRDTLRGILAAATEQGFITTDIAGHVTSVNPGGERILGRPEKDLVGLDVAQLVSVEALAAAMAGPQPGVRADAAQEEPEALDGADAANRRVLGRAVHGGTQVEQWECTLPDGSRRQVEFAVTPRPARGVSSPEIPAGYLVVVTDVTARYEEERVQDELVGLVSHELRTPLASILGYLDLLRLGDERLDDEQREYLTVVERNARRLTTLVDDLLTSAQIVSGAHSLTAELVDVVAVVRDAVASVRPAAEAADVQVLVEGDATVPLVSDTDRLAHVVDNLLSNAVKYSRPGGRVWVTVTGVATPDGARLARLRVTDEGTGIAADELTRVTERFYRSRDTQRRRVRGIGLGLALVDQIVRDHGGVMTIRSELGRGTEVDVTLPDLASSPGA
ncbi:ATP-binding protein [Isoptericola sp. NPDC057653]|uniref:PAS domain-containing sensor histidine kinase n=1 Tax=Isoptericola sp. NPDC057653 TaxID=3346195 RepID=UPI0036956C67